MRFIFVYIARQLYPVKYAYVRKVLSAELHEIEGWDRVRLCYLSRLLISGEDHRFFYHIGFDIIAIFRVIRNRIFYQRQEGASTIEQQLIRVLTNDFDRTLKRKIQEVLLSTTVASTVPKELIPLIYLNVAYYGAQMIGLGQAFKKLKIGTAGQITIEEAAEIISRIKYPQPTKLDEIRRNQIEARKKHLLLLHDKHSKRKYFKIYD